MLALVAKMCHGYLVGRSAPKVGPDEILVGAFVRNGANRALALRGLVLHRHAVTVGCVRVYELAQALGLPASEVVATLRADGEWVNSHLSVVVQPVADRYLPHQPVPVQRRSQDPAQPPPSCPDPLPAPARADRVRRPRLNRPGPSRATVQQPYGREHDDPIDDLRHQVEITTRDVAALLRVRQATVRRWVARGHISPVGKLGPSHVFNTEDVLTAYDAIKNRRKASGQSQRDHLDHTSFLSASSRPVDRIRLRHHDAVVDVSEAARLIHVSPATIRSWIHRGHLIPLASSTPRATRLRLGDVIATARSRQLPQRVAQRWPGWL